MIMIDPISAAHVFQVIAEQGKAWALVISIIIGGFKGFQWVKEIRTKDLKDLHTTMSKMEVQLATGFEDLGKKIDIHGQGTVSELKELRSDFRSYWSPTAMAPARAKAPRRKPVAKVPPTKKPAKKKTAK